MKNDTDVTQGYRIDGRLVWLKPGESYGKEAVKPTPNQEAEPDAYDGIPDDLIRDEIEDKAGKRPHHNTSRAKLIEQHKAL